MKFRRFLGLLGVCLALFVQVAAHAASVPAGAMHDGAMTAEMDCAQSMTMPEEGDQSREGDLADCCDGKCDAMTLGCLVPMHGISPLMVIESQISLPPALASSIVPHASTVDPPDGDGSGPQSPPPRTHV